MAVATAHAIDVDAAPPLIEEAVPPLLVASPHDFFMPPATRAGNAPPSQPGAGGGAFAEHPAAPSSPRVPYYFAAGETPSEQSTAESAGVPAPAPKKVTTRKFIDFVREQIATGLRKRGETYSRYQSLEKRLGELDVLNAMGQDVRARLLTLYHDLCAVKGKSPTAYLLIDKREDRIIPVKRIDAGMTAADVTAAGGTAANVAAAAVERRSGGSGDDGGRGIVDKDTAGPPDDAGTGETTGEAAGVEAINAVAGTTVTTAKVPASTRTSARHIRPAEFDWAAFGAARRALPNAIVRDPNALAGSAGRRTYGRTATGAPRTLHDHQTEAVTTGQRLFAQGHDRGLCVMPPRSGKTLTGAVLAKMLAEQYPHGVGDKKIVMVGHTQTIVMQNARTLMEVFGRTQVGVVMGRMKMMDKPVLSLSLNTWYNLSDVERAALGLKDAAVVILDEAQHTTYGNENFGLLMEAGFFDAEGVPAYQPGRLLLGLSGTPERNDKGPLHTIYGPEGIFFEKDLTYYRKNRLLRRPHPISLSHRDVQYDDLTIDEATGEYRPEDLIRLLPSDKLATDMAKGIKQKLATGKPGRYERSIAFVTGIQDAQDIAAALRDRHGIRALAIHSALSPEEMQLARQALLRMRARIDAFPDRPSPVEMRETLLRAAKSGEVDVLISDTMLIEGYDDPGIMAVILARAIGSRPFFVQAVMRGATPSPLHPGLETFKVLDFGGNFARLTIPISYTIIYQAEADGRHRYAVGAAGRKAAPGVAKERHFIEVAGLELREMAVHEAGVLYRPFTDAFKRLLLFMHTGRDETYPGEDETPLLTAALETLAKRYQEYLEETDFFATSVKAADFEPYLAGLAIPARLEDVQGLAETLHDTAGALVSAWAEIHAAILEANHPTQRISETAVVQQRWADFIHRIRVEMWRQHQGLLGRAISPAHTRIMAGLMHGQFPSRDGWEVLTPVLCRLIEAGTAALDVPAAIGYFIHIGQSLHNVLGHHFDPAEKRPRDWQLQTYHIADPEGGEAFVAALWRSGKVRPALAFVEHPDLEVVRFPLKITRGAMDLVFDRRTGRLYHCRQQIFSDGFELVPVKNQEVLRQARLQMAVIARLPEELRAFHRMFSRAFGLYAPSARSHLVFEEPPPQTLSIAGFLRGEVPGYVYHLLALEATAADAARGVAQEAAPRRTDPDPKKPLLPSDWDHLTGIRQATVATAPGATTDEGKRHRLEQQRAYALAVPTPYSDLELARGKGVTRWYPTGGRTDRARIVGHRWQDLPTAIPPIADKATVRAVARATARALAEILGMRGQIDELANRLQTIVSQVRAVNRELDQARELLQATIERRVDVAREQRLEQTIARCERSLTARAATPADRRGPDHDGLQTATGREKEQLEGQLAVIRTGVGVETGQRAAVRKVAGLEKELAALAHEKDRLVTELLRLAQHPASEAIRAYQDAFLAIDRYIDKGPARVALRQRADALKLLLLDHLPRGGIDPVLLKHCAEAAFQAHFGHPRMVCPHEYPRELEWVIRKTIQQALLSLGFALQPERQADTAFHHQLRQWHHLKDICLMMIGHDFFPHDEAAVEGVFQDVVDLLLPATERRSMAESEWLERQDHGRNTTAYTAASGDPDERRLAVLIMELLDDTTLSARFLADDNNSPYRRLDVVWFDHAGRVAAVMKEIQLLRLAFGFSNPWGTEAVLEPLRAELSTVEEALAQTPADDPVTRQPLLGRKRLLEIRLSAGSDLPKSPAAIAVILDVKPDHWLEKRLDGLHRWLAAEIRWQLRMEGGEGETGDEASIAAFRRTRFAIDIPQDAAETVPDAPARDDENTWLEQILAAGAPVEEVQKAVDDSLWQGMLVAAGAARPPLHDLLEPHDPWEPVDGEVEAPGVAARHSRDLPHRDGLDAFDPHWRVRSVAYELAHELITARPLLAPVLDVIEGDMVSEGESLPDDPRGLRAWILTRFPSAGGYLGTRADQVDDLCESEVVLLAAVAEVATLEEFGWALEWVGG